MVITFWKGVFCAEHDPGDVRLLVKCGFAMHEPTTCDSLRCRACRAGVGRRYWSARVEDATRLRSYCNPRALAAMKDHLGKLASSRALDATVDVPVPEGLSYLPYQRGGIAYALRRRDTLFADQMGLGKDQPLTAKLLTPSGWTTMGEIAVGDLVAGSDGEFYPVTGVYPQGPKTVYRVRFHDGAATECGIDHLWEVNSMIRWRAHSEPRVLSLREILAVGLKRNNGSARYLIQVPLKHLPPNYEGPAYRAMVEVKKVGVKETQCISVGSPDHLYVTDDYVLTHNTVEALGVANSLRPSRILVVCPATLCLNWKAEAEKWLCERYHLHLPETGDDPVPDVGESRLLCITNYDKLYGPVPRRRPAPVSRMVPAPGTFRRVTSPGYLSDLAARMRAQGPAKLDRPVIVVKSVDGRSLLVHLGHYEIEVARELGWESLPAVVLPADFKPTEEELRDPGSIRLDTRLTASLLRQKWDLGVFDECHALKNPDSLRSKAVLGQGGLYDNCRRTLFLSGTPMENKPVEIWPLAARLCPTRFGEYWEFARRYCGLHQEQHGKKSVWVADGSTHHSELQQRLRTSFMVRRLRQDVLKELPPKRRQLIPLDDEGVDWSRYPALTRWLSANNVAEYDAALARAESARTMQEYRQAIKHLEAVTAPFTEMSEVRHETALLKLPKCLRYTDELLADKVESLVIFAHHRDVLEKVHAHYGEDSCVVFGDTKMDLRMPTVREFQDGKKRIIIGSLRAAGVGITLTRASTMMLFESDWNPAVVSQAEDRLCRIGQTKMVPVIHPVLDHSLDAYMVKVMVAKQTVVDKMLDQLPEVARQKYSQTGDVRILANG